MTYLRNQIAKLANINVETLRYYESLGLISTPERNENGYRIYNDNTLSRLEVIKNVKSCGLTLEETKEFFTILYSESIDYDHINELIDTKIDVIDQKICQLNRMKLLK